MPDCLFKSELFHIDIMFLKAGDNGTYRGCFKTSKKVTDKLIITRPLVWESVPEMNHNIVKRFIEQFLKLAIVPIVHSNAMKGFFQFFI